MHPFGHPRLNCHLCRYATKMDANFPLLPNPSCRLLPLFSPSTPLHPSALTHPPARGPDPLPRHTGSSARGRPCLDLQGTPAQSPASRKLSEAVKISLNESGQWRGKTVTSTPASDVCLQHCVHAQSTASALGLSLPFPGVPSEPLQPSGGEGCPGQWDAAMLQHPQFHSTSLHALSSRMGGLPCSWRPFKLPGELN